MRQMPKGEVHGGVIGAGRWGWSYGRRAWQRTSASATGGRITCAWPRVREPRRSPKPLSFVVAGARCKRYDDALTMSPMREGHQRHQNGNNMISDAQR